MDITSDYSINQLSAEYVNTSIWRNYSELTTNYSDSIIELMLQGYDIDLASLKDMFDAWRQREEISSGVSAQFCESYNRHQIIDALRLISHDTDLHGSLKNARDVLIKVGLVEGAHWESHITTAPPFLAALLSHIKEINPRASIRVGDGSGHERDTSLLLRTSGIKAVLDDFGIQFVDLNVDDVVPVSVPTPVTLRQILIPRTILDSDFVISLARLKTHHWTGVTLGMKNMFGVIPGSIYGFPKNRLHWASYPRAIADIWSSVKPNYILIDGTVGIQGNGPLNGDKIKSKVIIGGRDPLETDGLAAQLMGISPYIIPQFWFGYIKGLGKMPPHRVGIKYRGMITAFDVPPNMPWLYRSIEKPVGNLFHHISQICSQLSSA